MDADKFSIAQMTSNESGKTSGSGTIGVYLSFIGGALFLVACIGTMCHNTDAKGLISDILMFTTSAAAMLTVRKVWGKDPGIETKEVIKEDKPQE